MGSLFFKFKIEAFKFSGIFQAVVPYTFNPPNTQNIQKAETGRSELEACLVYRVSSGHPKLHRETLSQTYKNTFFALFSSGWLMWGIPVGPGLTWDWASYF